ncbi:MAG: hypothetical protein IJW43_03995 [Clostridia bacterium]|nr:hypothetical protein [Clostridia bacterium]
MFVTANQLYVFLSCLSFGACFGVFRTLAILIKEKTSKNAIKGVVEITYFILLSFGFVLYSYIVKMPNLRVYMIVGVLLGNFLYVKSFHYILAKSIKRVYNILERRKIKEIK